MRNYGQFCAVARALELLDERWTLLIVREMLLGAHTFTEIRRGLPRIPRATLASRLRGLRKAGVIDATANEYRLTGAGNALEPVVRELARWASDASRVALTGDHLDTAALTWDMQRRVDQAALPGRTVVVAVDFTDRAPEDSHFWLHLSRTDVNLCREDTGAPVDVWLEAPTTAVTRWWLGQLSWAQFVNQPGVALHGNRAFVRQMHRWFLRYVFTAEALHDQ